MKTFLNILIFIIPFALLQQGLAQSPGDLDPTFGNNGRVITNIQPEGWATNPSSCLQSDGKIIVGNSIGNTLNIARYLNDGSLDNSWGQNGITTTVMPGSSNNVQITNMILLDDGNILVTGLRDTTNTYGTLIHPFIAKYSSSGVLDPNFSANGIRTVFSDSLSVIFGLCISNNKLLAFGISQPFPGRIFIHAFNVQDGSYDHSWGNNGTVDYSDETSNRLRLLTQTDQKIIMSRNGRIARFLPDGSYDPQFAQGENPVILDDIKGSIPSYHYPEENGQAYGVPLALQADDKILIAGIADPYSPYFTKGLIKRLDPDGNFDISFGNNGVVEVDFGVGFVNHIQSLDVQPDDRIVIIGNAVDTITNKKHFALARFNPNGSVDTTFGNNGVVVTSNFHQNEDTDYVRSILIEPNGKIILAGFTPLYNNMINGLPLNTLSLARYLPGELLNSNLNDVLSNDQVSFFPNPAQDAINVEYTSNKTGNVSYEVYNLSGQKLRTLVNENRSSGHYLESFDISSLSGGVYILKITSSYNLVQYKFVKN